MSAFRNLAAATIMLALSTGAAWADPIEGLWKTEAGSTAQIVPCAQGFCITLKTGQYAGREIGQLAAVAPGRYEGKVTKPDENKTYSGKATLSGSKLKLSGCVLVFCQTQTWSRQ